jgi:peptidyl-prolyl cis-trans isomerase A (cyclophilin A)
MIDGMRLRLFANWLSVTFLVVLAPVAVAAETLGAPELAGADAPRTTLRFDTVLGSFDVELFDDLMPRTVVNFLSYVQADRLDGTVVHRNADTGAPPRDFVIQGGGFFIMDPVPPGTVITQSSVVPDPAIPDEPGSGVAGPSNLRGTIAMAKSGIDTVTSQWFINQGDNSFLDDPARPDGGFSAFGMVLGNGMTVVDAIGDLPLPADFGFGINAPFNDLPLRDFSGDSIEDIRVIHMVVVNSISVVPEPSGAALCTAGLATLLLIRVARGRVADGPSSRCP